ncbi:MAG: hypothetical protein ACYTDU_13660 [Planctomycetota bacterium]|jgi:hypothetical protein
MGSRRLKNVYSPAVTYHRRHYWLPGAANRTALARQLGALTSMHASRHTHVEVHSGSHLNGSGRYYVEMARRGRMRKEPTFTVAAKRTVHHSVQGKEEEKR